MITKLSGPALEAYYEVLQKVSDFIGIKTEPVRVYADPQIRGAESDPRPKFRNMKIHAAFCNFGNQLDDNPQFRMEKVIHQHQGLDLTVRDVFEELATHETLHFTFYDLYEQKIKEFVDPEIIAKIIHYTEWSASAYKVEPGSDDHSYLISRYIEELYCPSTKGINEAFARWASDRIQGHRHTYEEVIENVGKSYSEEERRAIRYFYNIFHSLSEEKEDKFIINDLVNIVRQSLPIQDTKIDSLGWAIIEFQLFGEVKGYYKQQS